MDVIPNLISMDNVGGEGGGEERGEEAMVQDIAGVVAGKHRVGKSWRGCMLQCIVSVATCILLALNWILSFLRDMSENEDLMQILLNKYSNVSNNAKADNKED